MKRNINIINPEVLLKAMEDVDSDKFGQLSSEDYEMEHYEVPPLPGYEAQKEFPYCCDYHKAIMLIGKERFDKFPDCCAAHKRLHSAPWFRKENYVYMPFKFIRTLDYTRHCILTSLNNPGWHKEITDYIDETRNSYGQLPHGYGPPVGLELYTYNLEKYIESETKIPEEKRKLLLEFLQKEQAQKPVVEQIDLNLLINTYRQWLKIFPFELSFFRELKSYFKKQFPFLDGPSKTNMYSGFTGFKLVSKSQLISLLVSTTLSIIKELNTHRLFELGLLQQTDSLKIELILAKRKIELEELDKTDWNDRQQYIKLLKKWLKGEKQFLSEITPLVRNLHHPVFIQDLLNGMHELQKNDSNEACILNVRENRSGKETSFRYWFKNFFSARYPGAVVTAEEEKGKGRIDLKIRDKTFGDKIIEFKGWWNQDKVDASKQICSYLTDFEHTGYIFMINDRKKSIAEDYKKIITSNQANFLVGSLKEHKLPNSNLSYYQTTHRFGVHDKQIYHFIFNVWS